MTLPSPSLGISRNHLPPSQSGVIGRNDAHLYVPGVIVDIQHRICRWSHLTHLAGHAAHRINLKHDTHIARSLVPAQPSRITKRVDIHIESRTNMG